jgi:hypothetical protein
MADDSIDNIDFDDGGDEQDDLEYEDSFNPSPKMSASNARRELEKRLELKHLREMLDSPDFDDDF